MFLKTQARLWCAVVCLLACSPAAVSAQEATLLASADNRAEITEKSATKALVVSVLPNYYSQDDGITLAEIVRRAFETNGDVKIARLEVERARARLQQAALRANPTLEVEQSSGGIREVKAEMLPEHKADGVRELLEKYGGVAMVGDGVNDSPALALSSVGIAMGAAGSDTAIEAASVAILNDRLELIPYLVRLGRRAIQTIKINTTAAIATKLVFVILAIFGLSSLALAIFADVGVTVLVILNSLRLLKSE